MATLRYFIRPLLTATLAASATLPAFAFEDDRLTIWMGDNKGQQGIQLLAEQFLEETGIEVEVVFPDNLTDRFQQAAGSGQGPDIVIWAHDRMGEWAQSGLLKQVAPSDSFRESFYDFTWEAALWNGETYGYPISVESLGLIYNKALVDTPPESFAELMQLDKTLAQEGKKAILFDYSEPYYGWTLLAANGGYPFKQTDAGYDVTDIGVNNEGAVQGAELLVELIESDVVPRGTDYSIMDNRFNKGEVATMISGPWAWPNLERSGIDYGVALLPKVGDERAKPMFGVMTAMINSASPNDFLAVEFLENYLLSEEGMRTFNSDGSLGAVAHIDYQAELADNPNIAATLENAEVGMPMPNIPEMGAFWAAWSPRCKTSAAGVNHPKKRWMPPRGVCVSSHSPFLHCPTMAHRWQGRAVSQDIFHVYHECFAGLAPPPLPPCGRTLFPLGNAQLDRLMVLALLWLVMAFYMHGQWVFALLFLVLGTSLGVVFSRRSLMSHRYIFPAVAGLGVFVIFPLVYTVGISFSNYSSDNLLSQERVRAQLTNQTYQAEGAAFSYALYQEGELVRLYLESDAPAGDNDRLLSAALNLTNSEVRRVPTQAVDGPPEGEPLPMRAAIQARDALQALRLQTPGGTELRMAGLRQFAPMIDRYEIRDNGSLYDRQEDQVLTPDNDIGFFVTENGERITPGWPVNVGFTNYTKIFTDPDIRGPFMQIFVWTFVFAGLTVLFTLAVGFVLASLLQWDQLKGKAVYRTLLILPYAVPAFISILIFKGMFNQHFGEVNMILEALFGISPEWFTDPWLARTMLLIVNTWLGYPYMLLLCMG